MYERIRRAAKMTVQEVMNKTVLSNLRKPETRKRHFGAR